MTTPLEDRVRSTFETHAGGPADDDLDAVLATAVRGGTRIRRRRAMTAVAGITVWAVAVGVVAFTASRPATTRPAGPPSPAATLTAIWGNWPETSSTRLPSPPEAPAGTVTAASDPTVVGADIGLVHFRLGTLPVAYSDVSWGTAPGVEHAALNRFGAAPSPLSTDTRVTVTRSEALLATDDQLPKSGNTETPTTVGGRPATLFTHPATKVGTKYHSSSITVLAIRWQPVPGVWAQVSTRWDSQQPSVGDLLTIARGLRVDKTYQCGVPARTTTPPVGSRPILCTMMYGPTASHGADLAYGDGHGNRMWVILQGPPSLRCSQQKQPFTGGCYPDDPIVDNWLVAVDPDGKYTKADVARSTAGLRVASNPNDLTTWFPAGTA